MSPGADLGRAARAFRDELNETLNATICDGLRLSVTKDPFDEVLIGYGLTADDLTSKPIRVMNRGDSSLWLTVQYRLGLDDEGQYLKTVSSVIVLSTGTDGALELVHWDYERDKRDDYPEAHVQVNATGEAWRRILPSGMPLQKLHLPVGGRRYRPTVEEVVEFLIREGLATGRDGWREHLNECRQVIWPRRRHGCWLHSVG